MKGAENKKQLQIYTKRNWTNSEKYRCNVSSFYLPICNQTWTSCLLQFMLKVLLGFYTGTGLFTDVVKCYTDHTTLCYLLRSVSRTRCIYLTVMSILKNSGFATFHVQWCWANFKISLLITWGLWMAFQSMSKHWQVICNRSENKVTSERNWIQTCGQKSMTTHLSEKLQLREIKTAIWLTFKFLYRFRFAQRPGNSYMTD